MVKNRGDKRYDHVRFDKIEANRQATVNLLPESVEWMNALLEVCWGMVNPDMFQSVADTLEDVM